jgi:RNA polymerase sigma-70 factor, ECF subfamily
MTNTKNLERDYDKELIQRTVSGDLRAFTELVRKYEKPVAATVISMLGYCSEADDVGQEVFISFYKNIEKFRYESGVKTYLIRIAINLSLNELKRRKRLNFRFTDYKNVSNEVANDTQNISDNQEVIQLAINKLDKKMKAVVILRLIEGYSTKETAEILEIPEGTVLSRLARAQEILREFLKEKIRNYEKR